MKKPHLRYTQVVWRLQQQARQRAELRSSGARYRKPGKQHVTVEDHRYALTTRGGRMHVGLPWDALIDLAQQDAA